MKPLSTEIIPANPGFLVVWELEDEKKFEVGEPVIAWRIETHAVRNSEKTFTSCFPITVDGDAVSNCVGVQNPDMTITIFEDTNYKSLEELNQNRHS